MEKVRINPSASSQCSTCGVTMKGGEEHCFYEDFEHQNQDLSKTNILCWKCMEKKGPSKTTKSNKVLLRDICDMYDVKSVEVGEECNKHEESFKLWDSKYERVVCAQCIKEKKGSVEIGGDRYEFLEQRVKEMQKLLEEEIEEMDRAIEHYEGEGKKIEQMRNKVIKDAEECEAELRDCGERKAQSELQAYFKEQLNKLDNQEATQERLKQEESKIARREHTLKSRAHAIEEFVKEFLERPALWMKVDPLKLMEEDKQFWSALNENWDQKDFDLSYGEPEFKFSNDEVIDKLFKVQFSGAKETLEIKDYNN